MIDEKQIDALATPQTILADPGDLLVKAWNSYAAHSRILIGVLLLPSILTVLLAIFWGIVMYFEPPYIINMVVGYMVMFIVLGFMVWGHAALIYTSMNLNSVHHISDAYYRSLRQTPRFFFAMVLVSLVMLGGVMVALVPVVMVYWLLLGLQEIAYLVLVGSISLLLVFAVILPVWFVFVSYLAFEERPLTCFSLLKTSQSMVEGIWWRVFWRVVFVLLVVLLADTIIMMIPTIISVDVGTVAYELFRILDLLVLVFMMPLVVIYGRYLYDDVLRVQKKKVHLVEDKKIYPAYIPPAIVGAMMILLMCLTFAWALIGTQGSELGPTANEEPTPLTDSRD